MQWCSSVTLGNSLDFFLLSDGEGVAALSFLGFGGLNDLVGEALGEGLHGSESRGSDSLHDEIDTLVDSSEWRNIDGLSSDGTTGSNSSGVLSGSSLGNGIN